MKRCIRGLLLTSIVCVVTSVSVAEPSDPPSTGSADKARSTPTAIGAYAKPGAMIRVDDIGRRSGEESVTLVGRLGEPLATKLELRGRWKKLQRPPRNVYPMHPAVQFVVFEVNGKKLSENVGLDASQVKAEFLKWPSKGQKEGPTRTNAVPSNPEDLVGKEWTMTAYETGRFIAVPNEPVDAKVFAPVYALDFNQFRSSIVGVVTSVDGIPRDKPKSR